MVFLKGHGRPGAFIQEETCLKFSQAEGTLRQSWSQFFIKYYNPLHNDLIYHFRIRIHFFFFF